MLNLGDIRFGVGADITRLEQAYAKLARFGQMVDRIAASNQKGAESTARNLFRQEQAAFSAFQQVKRLNDTLSKTRLAPNVANDFGRRLNEMTRAYNSALTDMRKNPLSNISFGRTTRDFKAQLQEITREIGAAGRAEASRIAADKAAQAAVDASAKANAAAYERQRQAVFRLEQQIKSLEVTVASSKLAPNTQSQLFGRLDNILNQGKQSLSGQPLNSSAYAAEARKIQGSLNDVRRDFKLFNSQLRPEDKRESWENLRKGIHSLGTAALFASGHLGGISTRIFALTTLVKEQGAVMGLAAGAVVGFATGLATLSSSAVKAAMDLETTAKALEAVTGSSAMAQTEMKFVREVAVQSGTDFATTARAYSRFSAAATAAGQSLATVHDEFKRTALAAGTLHLAQEDVSGVFRALEQILSKGTVQSEELRGQLGDRFPAAFQIAAKAVGKTTAELSKMLKQGQVLSGGFVPAFTKAMTEFYNIDISKPVDTLQASLSRLSSQWTFSAAAIDKATGASRVYKAAVESLTSALAYVEKNSASLIGTIGGVVGAMVGLGAAMTAPAIFAGIATFARAITTFVVLAKEVRTASAAFALLSATLSATPIGWLSLLARGALAIGGAVLGYKLMTDAVNTNNAALSDTSGIEGYIAQQNALTTATQEATQEMLKQIETQMQIARNAARAAQGDYAQARGRSKPSQGDVFSAMTQSAMSLFGDGPAKLVSSWDAYNQRLAAMAERANNAANEAERLSGLQEQLNKVLEKQNKLPANDNNQLFGPGTNKDGRGRHEIDRIRDMIASAEEAQARMDMLAKSPALYKLSDDFFTAQKALNGLDTKQLEKVRALLGASSTNVDVLTRALQPYITATRQATEATQAFSRVWDSIREGDVAIKGLRDQLDFLSKGGDARELFKFDSINQARQMLADLSPEKIGAPNALKAANALRETLKSMGYESKNVEAGLTEMFNTQAKAAGLIQALTRIQDATRELNYAVNDNQLTMEAYSQGQRIGEAMDRIVDRQQKIRAMQDALKPFVNSQEELNQATAAYAELLTKLDGQEIVFDRIKTAADQSREVWDSFTDSALDNLGELITTSQSAGKALERMGMALANAIVQDNVINPLKNMLNFGRQDKANAAASAMAGKAGGFLGNLFGGKDKGDPTRAAVDAMAALAGSADKAGVTLGGKFVESAVAAAAKNIVGATTESIAQTAQSAQTAAVAQSVLGFLAFNTTMQVATATVTSFIAAMAAGGGGGGGGTLGKIINLGISAFAASQGIPTTSGSVDQMAGLGGFDGVTFGRAAGGPITKGNRYKTNERGTDGDYFIADASGWAYPRSSGGMGGDTHITRIDASTVIHAPGADAGTLSTMRNMLKERDSRLRKELGPLIDARVTQSKIRARV